VYPNPELTFFIPTATAMFPSSMMDTSLCSSASISSTRVTRSLNFIILSIVEYSKKSHTLHSLPPSNEINPRYIHIEYLLDIPANIVYG
jgi:hypothetical protein